MNDTSFHLLAIDSSKKYLQYLKEKNKGLAVTEVSHIAIYGDEAFLYLRGRLSPAGLDSLKLRIYADEFETDVICPVEYHSEKGVLILHPHKKFLETLPIGRCQHVSVISDLRFLVERVRDWYLAPRPPAHLPKFPSGVTPPALSDMAGGTPTSEQHSTVCNVMTTPFSYVWGAPGTGKTRFVLANCVLAYLRQNKQVLLTAPTNNALEQMLSGVLEVLRPCGIPVSCVYRFGIPSASFAAKYPDACEQRSVEARKAALQAEIDDLNRQYRTATSYISMQSDLFQLKEFYQHFCAISAQYQADSVPEDEITAARTTVKQTEEELNDLRLTIQELSIWFDSFPGRLSRFFRPSLYSEKSSLLNKSTRKSGEVEQAYTSTVQQLNQMEAVTQAAALNYYTQLDALRKQYDKAFQDSPIPALVPPTAASLDAFPAHLQCAYETLKVKAEKMPNPGTVDLVGMLKRLDALIAELKKLDANTEARWVNVRVWAMTMDRFIALNNTPSDFEPAHVFMDEAAYCSLIKSYTLLSLGRPVTLLGDHAQLPPVCEMNDHDLQYSFHPGFLWAQSAIHLDSVFELTEEELYGDYRASAEPRFYNLQVNRLSITHRFGPRLSHILSDFIYKGFLTSARSNETDIKYIHAPSSPTDEKRTSKTECDTICSLARQLTELGIDFAILTPYKAQVALLSKSMPTLSASGRIMTIHAAQGREFHTVIFSVVDTTNKFFTDSHNPIGRAVLNTAISRVKANLVLALDYDYWRTQKRQLIGRLLDISTDYFKNVS